MSVADELARERGTTRRRGPRRQRVPAGSTTSTRSIDLDTLDWTSDPWDDAQAAGSVERLRWQTRSVKWVAYVALVVAIVLILVAGAVGWWYIRQVNPRASRRVPASFTVAEGDTLQSLSERLEAEGFVADAGVFRWYVERHGGLEITPGYYELAAGDHMGNMLGRLRTPPSETYTKVTFPEGFTVAADRRPARPGHGDDDRRRLHSPRPPTRR